MILGKRRGSVRPNFIKIKTMVIMKEKIKKKKIN